MFDDLEHSNSHHRWQKRSLDSITGERYTRISIGVISTTMVLLGRHHHPLLSSTADLAKPTYSDKTISLKGKAVFVGLSEKLLAERKDSFYTVFSQANGLFIGGVEIAATAFLNMLHDSPVKPISARSYILLILFWGMVTGIICRITSVTVAAVKRGLF